MAIDAVFHELGPGAEGVIFGEFPVEEEDEGDTTNAAGFQLLASLQREGLELRPFLFFLESDERHDGSVKTL